MVAATVSVLPGTRLATIQWLPEDKRRELLRELGLTWEDQRPEVIALHLAAWAWNGFTPLQLQQAWQEYRYRLMVACDAEDGCADWHPHLFEEPPGPDSREAAVQRARDDAAEALAMLTGGTR